jgi:hypothetical protein
MSVCHPHYDPLYQVVRISADGLQDDRQVQHCMERAASLLLHTNCKSVLVDYGNSDLILSEQASEARFAEFARNIAHSRRVALVYKRVGERQLRFRDRAVQLGLSVGVFAKELHAIDWLLQSAIKL